ncbi:MAG: hypothetical protein HS124_10075 [Anaerolineales bacterium]|nr:hypothetical protein [Anaerolineales bacterium]MCL4261450.1 hypothetical protein [Anaerolineales bacterium]
MSNPASTNSSNIPQDLKINIRRPARTPLAEESMELHAARLLLLLNYAGIKGKIISRTKIAKMDFFIRYPAYLKKAASIHNIEVSDEVDIRPESPMIRYKYGPWDSKYYNIFALLVAKGLITIFPSKNGDVFELTDRGRYAVNELDTVEFDGIIERCKIVSNLFRNKTGSAIKDFIYEHFPEVTSRSLGEEIST